MPVLLGMTGLAIDMGNIYLAHSRLQTAVDAAALAGSLQLPYDPDMTEGLVSSAATEMVADNLPTAEVMSVSPGTDVRSVCVEAQVEVDMMLMGALGIQSKYIDASACAGFNNMEIVFVLDNSGSMAGSPINAVNQAASALVDLIMPDGTEASVKAGLVPFVGKVRIGPGVDGLPAGCRNADGSLDEGLRPEYTLPIYRKPPWSPLRVSSNTCSDIPQVLALSTDKDTIKAAISSQTASGTWSGTVISEGIKWGRHVLTPEAPFDQGGQPEDFNKIMIVLTDGDTEDGSCYGSYAVGYTPNNYWTNAYYNAGITDCHCEDGGCLNQAVLDEAAQAKAEDVEIFAIRFGVSDGTDVALMKAIASSRPGTDDHYFDAPSVDDIDDVFKLIGRQLGWRLIN